jgi:imidazoleglycerol-phosphate dehydratase
VGRTAQIDRRTKETEIQLEVDLDGAGRSEVATGIPFFDHMLHTLARHGSLDLKLRCKGDLEIDAHHTVEDCGIALGDAVDRALGDRAGIGRAGHFLFPLDEALARAVVDLSGRSFLVWDVPIEAGPRAALDATVVEGFFKAFADHARCALHLDLLRGRDFHHACEALFKAFARALRMAIERDARQPGIPSTKGVL